MNSEILDRAICFAVRAHSGAVRKKDDLPYILHPLEALVVAGTLTNDPETLCAVVLHDVVEDAGVSLAELEERFGPRVAALVASETEDKRPGRPAGETWRVRKEESLAKLRDAKDPAVAILWMGDKLSNMRSFHALWLREGDALWQAFNQRDPAQQAWYYRGVRDALAPLRDTPAWREYAKLVDEVFSNVPQPRNPPGSPNK